MELKVENLKEEIYLNNKIVSWINIYKEYDIKKEKWLEKKDIICHLFRKGSKNQPLKLGECNDGGKFTSVNQAINQAKSFINSCIKYKL
jgi:hypothetical protein